MKSQNAVFEYELETFRKEAEAAIQFLYAYLTVHRVAARNSLVHRLLNEAPLFWNTSLGALQTAAFIALGRVFDQSSQHNIDRLIRTAQKDPDLFSKDELARRKQGTEAARPEWLDDYLQDVYEPTSEDFRRLRSHIAKWRKTYESNYRDIRRKLFAHNEVSGQAETDALFKKTNIRELQRLCVSLASLHDALWHLYYNGRKPVLRPRRYSIERMRDKPLPKGWSRTVQERIVNEIDQFLVKVSGLLKPNLNSAQNAQRGGAANRRKRAFARPFRSGERAALDDPERRFIND
ncbi:MAG: transposase [Thermodesulfobacteriota bacterium]|nr:transposase [Thermodesulfobacteriota bacterium]